MWTPKRIVILAGGLVLFCCVYGIYAYFLGGIDGLPELPALYAESKEPLPPISPTDNNKFDKKLRLAFNDACPEVNRAIKLDFFGKGYGLAANKFEPEPDGRRIKLSPFSAFMVPKKQDKNFKIPEINTIRCDVAYLTLDHPISSMTELGNRKVIAVELCRDPARQRTKDDPPDITIKNNRGTPEESDDVELTIIDGHMYYDEAKNMIWTDKGALVKLFDPQSGKDPTTVTAKGMELTLTKDSQPKAKPAGKHKRKKGDAVTGVEQLKLLSRVKMHLFVDSNSGFLGGGAAAKKSPPDVAKEVKQPETSHVIINTEGPFTYDVPNDRAWFESPNAGPKETFRDQVVVQREHKSPDGDSKKSLLDEVKCDRLELQFRHKTEEPATADADGRSVNKDIESARATARTGDMVDLTMPTEKLDARSLELEYHCETAERGPKIILRGNPLMAAKEGHSLHAQELVLIGADKNGNGQTAIAKGPGQFDMFDKGAPQDAPESKKFPWKAVFKDSLTSTKDRVGTKTMDLLTLTGDAAILDEHKQSLQAQRLLIWLEPDEPGKENSQPPQENGSSAPRQKPNKLEGFGEVKMFSPEINIRKADHLKVYFTEEVGSDKSLPTLTDNGKPGNAPFTIGPPPVAGKSPVGEGAKGQTATDKDGKSNQPIDLEARDVVAYVTRVGANNYLRELVTEGNVHVTQKGNTPKDKGVDIKGDMLNLLHHLKGDILYVFGDAKKQAQLQLGELILAGPKVTINQEDNMARVEGIGFMEMPSNAAFDGGKPTKPGTRLTVHWNESMLFDGKFAEFQGGVVAYQEDASLRSQNMQVTLDRAVSLKEGQKDGQNAKVEILTCDGKVFIVEDKKDDKGNREKYYRLESTQVRLDNTVELVNASGPGKVIIISTGSEDQGLEAPRPQPGKGPPPSKQELQFTRIDYLTRMYSNNKDNVRTSKFYDNVEIYHAPGDRPDMKMDPDHPPKGGFTMRCEILTVYTRNMGEGKSSQYMTAERKVTFRTQEFFGNATQAKYDEKQELMIFEGVPGNPAKLYQFVPGTNQPREIVGMRILYNRRTGAINIDGASQLEGR
ncbi:MAG TPA: hypothetical protein VKE98_19085 [Gemmataceae bacterium]|nr:hypothetical protein [Gemmataceae bacterium]